MRLGFAIVAVIILYAIVMYTPRAEAGVVYNWQTVTIDPDVGPATGRIEFKPEVWQSGAFIGTRFFADPFTDFGVTDFDFHVSVGAPWDLKMALTPCKFVWDELCPLFDIGPDDPVVVNPWRLDVAVVFGSTLSGLIFSETSPTDATYHGFGNDLWVTNLFVQGGNCFFNPCDRMTGRWVLDVATVPNSAVPEPSTLWLLAIVGALAWVVRNRDGR